MKCWECNNEGTKQFDMRKPEYFLGEVFDYVPASQRFYCEECFKRVTQERESDRFEYVKLKKKLMYERAVRMLEKQDVDLYLYKEALECVKEYSENNLDLFDSAHEMVAAAVLIFDEIHIKTQYKVAGYRVDFWIPEMKIILEIDGMFHKNTVNRDSKRDIKIREELGYDVEVIRVDTKYIEQNAKMLTDAISAIREERQKIRKQNFGLLPDWYCKKKK